MRQSFYLVIPKQQVDAQRLKQFDAKILEQWLAELPIANPSLAARLFYDYLTDFNAVKMPAQIRLDALEQLRPSSVAIEDYLRSLIMRTGFPKIDQDKRLLNQLVALQKQITLSYWMTLKELTKNDSAWFQGKNTALAIQRCIKGLSGIISSYLMMGMPVPDWIWMDLHSLYKHSVKIKKNATQVICNPSNGVNKTSSPEDSYIQILLLSLSNTSGLMQKEIKLVYDFIDTVRQYVSLKQKPVTGQLVQCVVLTDEDKPPCFRTGDENQEDSDSPELYLDITKLLQALDKLGADVNLSEARFTTMYADVRLAEKPTTELLSYLKQRWLGEPLESTPLFEDRLDRYLAIGLTSTFKLQKALDVHEEPLEFLAHSASSRLLSCVFNTAGLLSVGSLVSFRRIDMPEHKRTIGIVDVLTVEKEEGKISFGVRLLAYESVAVTYLPLNSPRNEHPKPALFYSTDSQKKKNYIIIDTVILNEDDVVRLFVNQKDFLIMLKNKRNIGLGYWRFECLKITKKDNRHN